MSQAQGTKKPNVKSTPKGPKHFATAPKRDSPRLQRNLRK